MNADTLCHSPLAHPKVMHSHATDQSISLARARSFLFVPATRPERFHKALAAGADAVIFDLEDAVAPADKIHARANLANFFAEMMPAKIKGRTQHPLLCLRINSTPTPWHIEDMALAQHPTIDGILWPKADGANLAKFTADRSSKSSAENNQSYAPILPIIETATGIADLPTLTTLPYVNRVVFGTLDLALDLNLQLDAVQPDADQITAPYLAQLVLHSRVQGLAAPVAGVFTHFQDTTGCLLAAMAAKARGCSGMLLIHPTQVALAHKAFSPSAAEVRWAQQIVDTAANTEGTFSLNGQMIDAPLIARAQIILGQ